MKIAVIPARGGSKRISGKNIKTFAGKPLIAYSLAAANASGLFDDIIVSTDSDDIAQVARDYGATQIIKRPESLSNDIVGTFPVVQHAIETYQQSVQQVEHVCCIYATAPFLQAQKLIEGYQRLSQATDKHFAFSVTTFPFPIQRAIRLKGEGVEPLDHSQMTKRSQDLEECYHDAGQFYWGTTQAYLSNQPMFAPHSIPVVLPRHLVQDIDTPEDWERAELMYRAYVAGVKVMVKSTIAPVFIGDREIGSGTSPFIIAELSGNHNQSIDTARAMIKAAAEAGAHAIKLQTYTADSMTLDVQSEDFVIGEKDSLWYGASLYSLYQKASTPYEWHKPLFDYANELGMLAFSSPFDEQAVDFLDELNVPCFKIASFELTDMPLVRRAASKGKPLIMSTGMASLSEIEQAVSTAREAGCEQIILLKCTSTYPADPINTNLNTIPHLQQAFGVQVGLSDHTGGIGAAVASVALGATVVEKHFVLDRNGGGVDAAFSLEPHELKSLVTETERAWQALGGVCYGGTQAEDKAKQYRRSIYVSQDIKAGEALGPHNLKIVRPAFGLAPAHWDSVQQKTAKTALPKGTALKWEHIG